MPEALRLEGGLNREALERAVQTIVDRHESLRTHFGEEDGQPVQVIEDELRMAVPLEDLSGLEARPGGAGEGGKRSGGMGEAVPVEPWAGAAAEAVEAGRGGAHTAADAAITWYRTAGRRECSTGNSNELYEAYSEGRESPLKALAVQYADFALWQRKWLESGGLEEGLEYWKRELAGIRGLELPADRRRPSQPVYAADACAVRLGKVPAERLKRVSQDQQTTLYMTLLAAFAVVLERYTGQADIVVGSPIANRQESLLEDLIGVFVNTLAIRMRVKGRDEIRGIVGAGAADDAGCVSTPGHTV